MTTTDAAIKADVHARLIGSDVVGQLGGEVGPERDVAVRRELTDLLGDAAPLLGAAHRDRLLAELTREVTGLGPLEPLLEDDSITEVMLNGPHRAFVERAGVLHPVDLGLDSAAITRVVDRVIAPLGLRLDRSSPMVDARLADGSRLHAIIPPLALDGPCVTIRRFGARDVTLGSFGVGPQVESFLGWTVASGWNVVVAGGTGAGKTTLLNALSRAIDDDERIVTIEETAELRLAQGHIVRMEARPANAEGAGGVSVRDLVRAALRMRPDRLIVGEVRGGEAFDMLQALNTGHDGSLSTVHANSGAEALLRLETLAMLAGTGVPVGVVRAQIAMCVDAVVQVARGVDGDRRIVGIGEVMEADDAPPGFRSLFEMQDARLQPIAVPTRTARRVGTVPPDPRWFSW